VLLVNQDPVNIKGARACVYHFVIRLWESGVASSGARVLFATSEGKKAVVLAPAGAKV